jgi:hypothetical protein
MKKLPLLLLIANITLLSCQQKSGHKNTPTSFNGKRDTTAVPMASSRFFYAQLKGTLDQVPITMQLLKAGPDIYRGYYWHDETGAPISIWGSLDGTRVSLYEDGGNGENFFNGILSDDGTFKGVWHGNTTAAPFSLATDLTNAVRFDVLYATDSLVLIPEHPKSPVGYATNSIVWPAKNTTPEIAAFIEQIITGGKAIHDPHEFVRLSIDSFMAIYKYTAREIPKEDLDNDQTASFNWSADGEMKVVWNQYPLLVLEKSNFDFTGGAHGNGGSLFKVLDLHQQKVLSPDDVFNTGYQTALSPLLDNAFREKFGLSKHESLDGTLLVSTIPPNHNFFLTNTGVAFSYAPYEIGPYAMGQVTLFIPFKKLKGLLKTAYK